MLTGGGRGSLVGWVSSYGWVFLYLFFSSALYLLVLLSFVVYVKQREIHTVYAITLLSDGECVYPTERCGTKCHNENVPIIQLEENFKRS